jgi:hypothetical protein
VSRHERYLFGLVLARWGFAALVAAAIACAFITALTVSLPTEIPSIALRDAAVYRVEVGAAVFFGLYLATMAFTLALHNRGFTEIGSGGFKARDLAADSEEANFAAVAMELLAELREEVDDLQLRRRGDGDAY